jgi:hypothetical protein
MSKNKIHVVRTMLRVAMGAVFFSTTIPIARAQAPATGNATPAPPKKTETLLHKVLRISGISANSFSLKGPGDEVKLGQVWLVDLASGKKTSLTAGGGYRSPVFAVGNEYVLALYGSDVVRLNLAGATPRKLCSVSGMQKIVGPDLEDADKFLILEMDGNRNTVPALLSVGTGKVEPMPFDATAKEDRQTLEVLRGWDRVYGDKSVFVQQRSKDSLAGPVEWTDVYFKDGAKPPVNASDCDEVICGQPSLSPDGKLLLFVKTGADTP